MNSLEDPGGLIVAPPQLLKSWKKAIIDATPRCRDFKQALEYNREPLKYIWQTYTQQRKSLGRLPLTDAALVAPYLIGFHLSNWARVYGAISRGLNRGLRLPEGDGPIRIIDLGCGSGAAGQAAYSALNRDSAGSSVEFELIDRSRHLLEAAKGLTEGQWPQAKVRTLNKSLDHETVGRLHKTWQARPARLNVLMMSYVWNEIGAHRRVQNMVLMHLRSWLDASKPTWLVITEPAAEESARQAMALRDSLVRAGWTVVYPCPTSQACPMGNGGRDWCYSEFKMTKSPEQLAAERPLAVSRETLGAAAYLFLNRAATKKYSSVSDSPVAVGFPKVSGEQQMLICDGNSLTKKANKKSVLRGSLAPTK